MNVTLITGASGGIGKAMAERFAADGHNLFLIARSEDKLQALCATLGTAHRIKANNAGIGSGGDFLENLLKSELDMMHLNMAVPVALAHRFLPGMRKNKAGTLINVASMACFVPIPYRAVYAATKAFHRSFTEAVAEENKPYNIRTMLLCPGATETNFFEAAQLGGERKKFFSSKKLETPEQVAETALKGLKQGKRIAVSGTQNRLAARLVPLIPNAVGLPLFAKQKRRELNLHPV